MGSGPEMPSGENEAEQKAREETEKAKADADAELLANLDERFTPSKAA